MTSTSGPMLRLGVRPCPNAQHANATDDAVTATGDTHSLLGFAEPALRDAGINVEWRSQAAFRQRPVARSCVQPAVKYHDLLTLTARADVGSADPDLCLEDSGIPGNDHHE